MNNVKSLSQMMRGPVGSGAGCDTCGEKAISKTASVVSQKNLARINTPVTKAKPEAASVIEDTKPKRAKKAYERQNTNLPGYPGEMPPPPPRRDLEETEGDND